MPERQKPRLPDDQCQARGEDRVDAGDDRQMQRVALTESERCRDHDGERREPYRRRGHGALSSA